nr:MAG TPA: hypothetical protein [Inoviridae sp.]
MRLREVLQARLIGPGLYRLSLLRYPLVLLWVLLLHLSPPVLVSCLPGGVSVRGFVLLWRHSVRAVCQFSLLGSGLPWLGPFFERKVYGN